MTVSTKYVRNAQVWYDNAAATVSGGNRWYDAIGPGVTKYITEFQSFPYDDTTNDPTEWYPNITEAGAGVSTAVVGDIVGGGLVITTAASDDDGYQMQLGVANSGEWVSLDAHTYTYFGIEFAVNDADATDTLFGICVTDTDCLGGVTDGMYFRSVDGTGVNNFVIEKNSVESSTATNTLTDDTYVTCEFFVDGPAGYVYAYVDGTLQATIATSDASFPNDEDLRATIELLTGDNSANTCTIKWVRLIHIR